MRFLVTEAASPVAYQLVQLIASGDVIPHQAVELTLCDRKENIDVVNGVRCELLDCVYPLLSRISTSCDFCESFKSADVVVMLPDCNGQNGCHGKVEMCYSSLTEVDFKSLDGALYPTGLQAQDSLLTAQTRGPLSTAVAIANYLKQIYKENVNTTSNTMHALVDKREEAMFGMMPDTFNFLLPHPPTDISDLPSLHVPSIQDGETEMLFERLDGPFQETQVTLVFVSVTDTLAVDDKNEEHSKEDAVIYYHSKL